MKIRITVLISLLAVVGVGAAVVAGAVHASGAGMGGRLPTAAAHRASSVTLANCKISKADFITNDTTGLSTSSGTFVPVPGMTTVISVAGTTASCVLVEVSGDSLTDSGEGEGVGVTLDGRLANPSFVQFSMNDPSAAQEHAALFAFPSVAPGSHTVAMVFESGFGGTVIMSHPAMRIDHR